MRKHLLPYVVFIAPVFGIHAIGRLLGFDTESVAKAMLGYLAFVAFCVGYGIWVTRGERL